MHPVDIPAHLLEALRLIHQQIQEPIADHKISLLIKKGYIAIKPTIGWVLTGKGRVALQQAYG